MAAILTSDIHRMTLFRRFTPAVLVVVTAACSSSAPATPTPAAATGTSAAASFALTGSVTDGVSGAAVTSALVSVADAASTPRSTTTDAAGRYAFPDLPAATYMLSISAARFVSTSATVSLTANQTLSVQLTQTAPAAAASEVVTIGFGGLTANRADASIYSESGFTVRTTAASWHAVTT